MLMKRHRDDRLPLDEALMAELQDKLSLTSSPENTLKTHKDNVIVWVPL